MNKRIQQYLIKLLKYGIIHFIGIQCLQMEEEILQEKLQMKLINHLVLLKNSKLILVLLLQDILDLDGLGYVEIIIVIN